MQVFLIWLHNARKKVIRCWSTKANPMWWPNVGNSMWMTSSAIHVCAFQKFSIRIFMYIMLDVHSSCAGWTYKCIYVGSPVALKFNFKEKIRYFDNELALPPDYFCWSILLVSYALSLLLVWRSQACSNLNVKSAPVDACNRVIFSIYSNSGPFVFLLLHSLILRKGISFANYNAQSCWTSCWPRFPLFNPRSTLIHTSSRFTPLQ